MRFRPPIEAATPMKRPARPALFLLCLLPLALAGVAAAAEPPPKAPDARGVEFFESKVRPLLVEHCGECHIKADEPRGGLSLASRAGWQTGGDSGPAIAPGKPDESLLIQAVRYESYEMPPDGKLSDSDIAILEKWVVMGAPDPRDGEVPKTAPDKQSLAEAREFWAFQLPEPRHVPEVRDAAWPRDPLDHFILARLEAKQLRPAPPAAPNVWLRRVTYDLTGLPPTPEELAAFERDAAPDARARVVDRLLASPQFGVHWGRHWLDVARYADSNGGDFNATFFNAWRYRNYVIEAFNRDKPFDQFIREQIAGDLLPASSDAERADQLVATTFLMIGPKMLSERNKEKLTMDVVDEQIDTVGKAFLGLTLGCARCHDHKFDPISTEEYYALAGIFRSTVTLEGESQKYVSTWVGTPLPMSPELERRIEQAEARKTQLESELAAAEKKLKAAQGRLAKLRLGRGGVLVDDAAAKIVGKWKDSKYSPHFVGAGYLHDEKTGKGEKSITWTPDLPRAGKYEVRIAYAGAGGRDDAVPVTIRHAEGETKLKLDQSRAAPIGRLFKSLGVFRFEAGKRGGVTLSNAGTTGYVIADAVLFVPQDKTKAEASAPPAELDQLAAEVAELEDDVKRLEAELKRFEKQAPKIPKAMAAREAPHIGDCRVCIRGDVGSRGELVERGFLRVVSGGPARVEQTDESGRRELADWIARGDNPLTARVIVNRVWQNMFGEGIVRTTNNFGHQGTPPSHPELLDTLAVDFVQGGWSVKSLVRRIALSQTYAMSTRYDAAARAVDPDNRLLWRARRKRLPAEALRDSMLQFSGRLDLSPGGSPVKGLGRLAINNTNQSASGKKTDSARRSVYLPIIRNELPTFLTVFDFADPEFVTGRRPVTNVPAQALFLLNDPFVKEQSRAIAERLLAAHANDSDRLEAAFRLILARRPTDDQRASIRRFLDQLGDKQDKRLAAWSQVVQSLLASTQFRLLN